MFLGRHIVNLFSKLLIYNGLVSTHILLEGLIILDLLLKLSHFIITFLVSINRSSTIISN